MSDMLTILRAYNLSAFRYRITVHRMMMKTTRWKSLILDPTYCQYGSIIYHSSLYVDADDTLSYKLRNWLQLMPKFVGYMFHDISTFQYDVSLIQIQIVIQIRIGELRFGNISIFFIAFSGCFIVHSISISDGLRCWKVTRWSLFSHRLYPYGLIYFAQINWDLLEIPVNIT